VSSSDYDLERIVAIAHEGLERARQYYGRDVALDTFVLTPVLIWRDDNDAEIESVEVWGESRKQYVKTGVLNAALDTVAATLHEHEPPEG
jgi:hypothetical protein